MLVSFKWSSLLCVIFLNYDQFISLVVSLYVFLYFLLIILGLLSASVQLIAWKASPMK